MAVVQVSSERFGRYSNIARFQLPGANDVQPLPELHVAVLSWMGPNGFGLTGFEVVGVNYFAVLVVSADFVKERKVEFFEPNAKCGRG